MGTNWGAFAGALTNSALSTYERLGEEELRQMQRDQLKKDIAEKEALDTAWRESQARVGQQDDYAQAIKTGGGASTEQAQMLSDQGALRGNTAADQEFEKASAQAAAGAMRENAVRQGAIATDKAALPEMKPTEVTATQGMDKFLASAKGISRKGTVEAIQLKQLVQQAETEDTFRKEQIKLNDTLARIHGTAETGGLKGLYEAGKQEGLKLNFVEGKNGVGSRIQVLGPKGDVLETVSDVAGATSRLEQAAMQQFMQKSVSLLGTPDKVLSYMQKEKELGIKQSEVDIKKPYYQAGANLHNAQAGALGKAAEITAAGKAYMDEYNKLTPQDKNGPKGKALLDQAEGAMAAKSGDVARIRANTPEGRAAAGYEVAAKEAAKAGEPLPSYDKYMAGRGFAPDAVKEGEQAKVDAMLKKGDFNGAINLAKQFNNQFKHTPIPVPSGAVPVPGVAKQSAVPVSEDKTKYIREKNNRGGWVYTPSGRGQTKAQYAAIDANQ